MEGGEGGQDLVAGDVLFGDHEVEGSFAAVDYGETSRGFKANEVGVSAVFFGGAAIFSDGSMV